MPINVIGFAMARVEAGNRGVSDQEATRIGVIGSVMPNPIMSLVVARAMADKEAPAPESQTQGGTVIDIGPRDPATGGTGTAGGTGTTGTGGTGTAGGTGTGTTGSTGTGTPGTGTPSPDILAHIDEAKASADQAKAAAAEANQAVHALSETVKRHFHRIEQRLQQRSPSSRGRAAESTPAETAE